jgi:endoglucanase
MAEKAMRICSRIKPFILSLFLLTVSHHLVQMPIEAASESPLPFVRADGGNLIDEEGKTVFLRGISFGNDVWYKSHYDIPVGHHSEEDYGRVATMGFNSICFYVNYQLFEWDDAPFTYRESGFAWLDQNIAWARKYGVYLILNMHVPQGGHQSNGHGSSFWDEPTNQERFIALWKVIARRYKDEAVILGYGILNEPWPTENIAQWETVARSTAAAIRQEDRNHILIVERALQVEEDFLSDNHNGELNFVLLDDSNVMYEFHFYAPHSFTH